MSFRARLRWEPQSHGLFQTEARRNRCKSNTRDIVNDAGVIPYVVHSGGSSFGTCVKTLMRTMIRQTEISMYVSTPRAFSSASTEDDLDTAGRTWDLACFNVGRLKQPYEAPALSEFRQALDPINLIATRTPGFLWMYDSNFGNDKHLHPRLEADPLLMPQLSLWTDCDKLRHYVYQSGHSSYLRRRKQWFEPISGNSPFAVCWYRPSHWDRPDLVEAFNRLDYLSAVENVVDMSENETCNNGDRDCQTKEDFLDAFTFGIRDLRKNQIPPPADLPSHSRA